MLIVTICIGEMFIFLSTKKVREPEAHELIANELKLFQLLKETIQKESELNMNIISMELSKNFLGIHNRDNYTKELNAAANLLFNTDEIRYMDYANLVYKLEHQIHKENTREMHICIKTHLGTGQTSENFYSAIESPNLFSRIFTRHLNTRKFNKNVTLCKLALCFWFILNALFNAIVYHIDFVKDVFLVVSMAKFIQVSDSTIQSVNVQFFFLFCLSIIISILSNSILILFKTTIMVLKSWKVRTFFVTLSVLSPSVAQYIVHRLYLEEKSIDKNHIDKTGDNIEHTMQEINHITREKRFRLKKHILLLRAKSLVKNISNQNKMQE